MQRKIISLTLLVLLVLSFCISASAASNNGNRTGSMTIKLQDPYEKKPIANVKFDLYHVARVQIDKDQRLIYSYMPEFQNCGIQLEDPELAAKLADYVSDKTIPCKQMETDQTGNASITDLKLGMYLVVQHEALQDYSQCSPFLVMIPSKQGADLTYDVNASPKTDVVKEVDITIKKVWNTGKTSQIPGSVTIRLFRDGETVSNSILNADNNWQVVLEDMPASDGYSVQEMNVPLGYTATYAKSGYVFTVTNTASLAQTGQLVWPIPVLAAAGLFFLMLGMWILRKSGKHYA